MKGYAYFVIHICRETEKVGSFEDSFNQQLEIYVEMISLIHEYAVSFFIPNKIQHYNTVCMSNTINSRVIIDTILGFFMWPPEKP